MIDLGPTLEKVPHRRNMLRSMALVAAGTLTSRVLGLLRDVATVSLLGLSGGVFDALVVAFRIPNLFRGLFGEGALATCYVPHLAGKLNENRQSAWETATALALWLSVLLSMIVLLGIAACGLLLLFVNDATTRFLLGLTAMLLPYLFFVCLAAQAAATLQTLGRFAWPAIATNLLNVVWLIAAWQIAPRVSDEAHLRAIVLAGAILLAGILQLAVQLPGLWRLGFRWRYTSAAGRETIAGIVPGLGPTLLSLAVTRINTLCDSLFAWCLASSGAAGAVYCAERLCHLPIGLLGVTVATVVFPRLSRHAAAGNRSALADDLIYGLRLVALIAIPASFGLWLLAEPLTGLLFQRGEFTAENVVRTARVVRGYSLGVWACCAIPVLLRAFYALADRRTPLLIGIAMVTVNLAANALLVRPLGEAALAVTTSGCAVLQTGLLLSVLAGKVGRAEWSELAISAARATVASLLMFLAGRILLQALGDSAHAGYMAQVAWTLPAAMVVYVVLMWLAAEKFGLLATNGPAGAGRSSSAHGL